MEQPREGGGKVREMSIGYLTGNQAVAEGAMAAGLKFYAGYPITPASDLFEYLSEKLPPKRGGSSLSGRG